MTTRNNKNRITQTTEAREETRTGSLPFVFTPAPSWDKMTLEVFDLGNFHQEDLNCELAPTREDDTGVPDDVLGTFFAPFDQLRTVFPHVARPTENAIARAFREVVKEFKKDGGELPPREKLEALALGLAGVAFGWLRADNSVTLFSSKLGQGVNRDYVVSVK